MKLRHVFSTPTDGHYFFGYFDKSPLDGQSSRLLAQRAAFMDRLVRAGDRLEIGAFDFPGGGRFHNIAETSAWNWQQGCQLQWRGPAFDREIIFNDMRGGRFVSVVCDVCDGSLRELPIPVYAASADGRWALSIDYERHYWFRPAYNYDGIANQAKRKDVDREDGIWLLDLESGEYCKVVALRDLLAVNWVSTMRDGPHYFEHVMFNPSGSRFAFLHRWRTGDGGIVAHLHTADRTGRDRCLLNDSGKMSHFCWRDDEWILGYGALRSVLHELRKRRWSTRLVMKPLLPLYHALRRSAPRLDLSGQGFLLFKDRTREATRVTADFLRADGHMTFRPGSKSTFVTDTYPDREGACDLILVDLPSGSLLAKERLHSMPEISNTGYRADLHPKWSFDGRFVSVDTARHGRRGIDVFEVVEV